MHIELLNALDSKDLFETLSTCRNSIDRSIRADVSVIRYEFETHKVNRIIWIPGKLNLEDTLTKTNSPLVDPLQLMFSLERSLYALIKLSIVRQTSSLVRSRKGRRRSIPL